MICRNTSSEGSEVERLLEGRRFCEWSRGCTHDGVANAQATKLMPDAKWRFRGALVGLAVGDAVGTTLEFTPKGKLTTPVTDMVGGGPFQLAPGQWTDDTSMALCLARSLVLRGFDPLDQMERYLRWWKKGYLSSTGTCFDIGNTVRAALLKFEKTKEPYCGPTDSMSAGNGSLMRLAPVAMYFAGDPNAVDEHAALMSRTTHGAAEAVDACRLFASQVALALAGAPKSDILTPEAPPGAPLTPNIEAIRKGAFAHKSEAAIHGTGYVVHSLEAALWCFATTNSFEAAILAAANLGDDADTTAAICGQLAGAFYGESEIPPGWREKLARGDQIARLADALRRARAAGDAPLSRSYWANPGAVIGGAYPGHIDYAEAGKRASSLLDAGVEVIVNLMEPGETNSEGQPFAPYQPHVDAAAEALGKTVALHPLPIPDLSIPELAQMVKIQASLDQALASDLRVYVHCWGGRGRTGTVVGIHLIRHCLAEPDDFVREIAWLRRLDAGGGKSPETNEQIAFVRKYVEDD
jgi:ADP-ribosyl-[dinitrogen reductase] hydrolase